MGFIFASEVGGECSLLCAEECLWGFFGFLWGFFGVVCLVVVVLFVWVCVGLVVGFGVCGGFLFVYCLFVVLCFFVFVSFFVCDVILFVCFKACFTVGLLKSESSSSASTCSSFLEW